MDAPIKPRYTYVDQQIDYLEITIRDAINVRDLNYWREVGELSLYDNVTISTNIRTAFQNLLKIYETSHEVSTIIEETVILLQNCAWCALNVMYVEDYLEHVNNVSENVLRVFHRISYPYLRTEMIMANHHCEMIQRVWRRCATDPVHPVCRRRLIREFDMLV